MQSAHSASSEAQSLVDPGASAAAAAGAGTWPKLLTLLSAAASRVASLQEAVDASDFPSAAVAPVRLCNDSNLLPQLLRTKLEPEQDLEEERLLSAGMDAARSGALPADPIALEARVDQYNDMLDSLQDTFKAALAGDSSGGEDGGDDDDDDEYDVVDDDDDDVVVDDDDDDVVVDDDDDYVVGDE